MSQKPVSGTWYAYRYNVSRDVLKSSETTLTIGQVQTGSRQVHFELSGWGHPIETKMINDPTTQAWHGEFDSLDFRWSRVECDGKDILIGHVLDRANDTSRDFFVAVRSKRTQSLPEKDLYTFENAYVTPTLRCEPLMKKANVSIDMVKGQISFEKRDYSIIHSVSCEGGLRLIAETVGPIGFRRIGLWLLPIHETDHLLATGFFYHMAFGGHTSRPTSPECNFCIVLC